MQTSDAPKVRVDLNAKPEKPFRKLTGQARRCLYWYDRPSLPGCAVYVGKDSEWCPEEAYEDGVYSRGAFIMWLRGLPDLYSKLTVLADKDLVCECSEEERCHADDLMYYANSARVIFEHRMLELDFVKSDVQGLDVWKYEDISYMYNDEVHPWSAYWRKLHCEIILDPRIKMEKPGLYKNICKLSKSR